MDASLAQLTRAGKINRQLAESRAHSVEELRRLLGGALRPTATRWRSNDGDYTFKAMDIAGVPARGEVDAVSKQAVADQLKERGLIVLEIAHKYRSKELNIELFKRVKASELAVATRQLSTMISSGMTILRALTCSRSRATTPCSRRRSRTSAGTSRPA